MKIKSLIYYLSGLCFLILVPISRVLAYTVPPVNSGSNITPADPKDVGLELGDVAWKVINVLLLLAGIAAVIVIVWSGINYITAGADSSKAQKAKNMLVYAVLGIILITGSYILFRTVIEVASTETSQPELHGSF